mmetsp:Transcript_12467/g.44086  ORF Transcript_12467/g.44086 Transcript_12467/m.44086 type:complete len:438 (+) Transcript_12467:83-1396(+)
MLRRGGGGSGGMRPFRLVPRGGCSDAAPRTRAAPPAPVEDRLGRGPLPRRRRHEVGYEGEGVARLLWRHERKARRPPRVVEPRDGLAAHHRRRLRRVRVLRLALLLHHALLLRVHLLLVHHLLRVQHLLLLHLLRRQLLRRVRLLLRRVRGLAVLWLAVHLLRLAVRRRENSRWRALRLLRRERGARRRRRRRRFADDLKRVKGIDQRRGRLDRGGLRDGRRRRRWRGRLDRERPEEVGLWLAEGVRRRRPRWRRRVTDIQVGEERAALRSCLGREALRRRRVAALRRRASFVVAAEKVAEQVSPLRRRRLRRLRWPRVVIVVVVVEEVAEEVCLRGGRWPRRCGGRRRRVERGVLVRRRAACGAAAVGDGGAAVAEGGEGAARLLLHGEGRLVAEVGEVLRHLGKVAAVRLAPRLYRQRLDDGQGLAPRLPGLLVG